MSLKEGTFVYSRRREGVDGHCVANVVELPRGHTQAETLKELDGRVKQAIELNLEAK
jgi:predicted RNase H-like HicB family nuclease